MRDSVAPLSGDWDFDPEHTSIGFSARHAMVTTVRGSFTELEGRIHADLADMSNSRVEVTIQAASVDTRSHGRDDHLRSADFLDVENYPHITFVSSRVEEIEDGAFIVTGDLTIRDVSQQMSIPIHLAGVETDAFGVLRAGFEGSRRVNRRDFGLRWNMALDSGGVLVSERILLTFDISATRRAPSSEPAQAEEVSGADALQAPQSEPGAEIPVYVPAEIPADVPAEIPQEAPRVDVPVALPREAARVDVAQAIKEEADRVDVSRAIQAIKAMNRNVAQADPLDDGSAGDIGAGARPTPTRLPRAGQLPMRSPKWRSQG